MINITFFEGETTNNTKSKLDTYYGIVSQLHLLEKVGYFRSDQVSKNGAKRSAEVRSPEGIKEIHIMVIEHRGLNLRETAN